MLMYILILYFNCLLLDLFYSVNELSHSWDTWPKFDLNSVKFELKHTH